jgi:hypothetical protein
MSCNQASDQRFARKFGLGGAREHMRQPDDQRESRGYRRDGEEKQFGKEEAQRKARCITQRV